MNDDRQPILDVMTDIQAPTSPHPLHDGAHLGRVFADLGAELGRATDPAGVTAAVESLVATALRLGTRECWATWDSWSGWNEPATEISPTEAPPTPSESARSFTLHGIREERPGPRWRALFDATWPAYRAWYLRDGDAARPDLATARARLAEHMPGSSRPGRRWST